MNGLKVEMTAGPGNYGGCEMICKNFTSVRNLNPLYRKLEHALKSVVAGAVEYVVYIQFREMSASCCAECTLTCD